jgi:hypothetical protein
MFNTKAAQSEYKAKLPIRSGLLAGTEVVQSQAGIPVRLRIHRPDCSTATIRIILWLCPPEAGNQSAPAEAPRGS